MVKYQNFRMVPTWKTKIGKTSEFLDAGVKTGMRERKIGDGRKEINLL
jgi:hypothetical protein